MAMGVGRRHTAGHNRLRNCLVWGLGAFALAGPLSCGGNTAATGKTHFAGARCEPTLVFECENLCTEGDMAACEIAGSSYIEGRQVTRDLERAKSLLAPPCNAERPIGCGGMAKLAQEGVLDWPMERIVKRLDAACEAKDADACQRRGQLLLAEGSSAADNKARTLFERACSGGSQAGCFQKGKFLLETRPAEAIKLFTAACKAKVGSACYELGGLQESGTGGDAAPQRALNSYERACELDVAAACSKLGQTYEQGSHGALRDLQKTKTHLEKACDLGEGDACAHLGELLASGDGIEPDEQAAGRLFEQGCELKSPRACLFRGRVLEQESAVSEDVTDTSAAAALAATQAYEAACDGGESEACGYLARMLIGHRSIPLDEDRAVGLFEKACSGEGPEGVCVDLAALQLKRHAPKDAVSALKRGCEREGAACLALARHYEHGYGVTQNRTEAAKLYLSACQQSVAPGCVGLAHLAYLGSGTDADPEGAVAIFEEYCEQDNAEACRYLALALASGEGLEEPDGDAARSLADERCAQGDLDACALGSLFRVRGVGGRRTPREGLKRLSSLCGEQQGLACSLRAHLPGVKSPEKASLRARACALGEYSECRWLEERR